MIHNWQGITCINDSNNGIVDKRFMVISLPVCLIQGIRIVGYGKTCAQAGEALFNGADYKTTG
jgi:hypothetical protein